MPMTRDEKVRRYANHVEAMTLALKDVQATLAVTAAADLSVDEIDSEIDSMMDGLRIASYHVSRMKVYDALLSRDAQETAQKGKTH
jgi:hypothetical protein